jgi:cytoskeletal protein RodZ
MASFSSKSFSDNRKSKIENLKWLGLSVIAFVLVVTGVPRWSVTLTSTWTSERIYFVVRHLLTKSFWRD